MAPPRLAVIGLGKNGTQHLKRFLDAGAEVVGIADPSPEALESAGRETGLACLYADHREMLEETAPAGVCVSTPNRVHAPLACDALRAGADVLLEKPMATTLAQCRTILDAEAETGKQIMMGFCCRYRPETYVMKDLVAAGRLGEIESCRVEDLRRRVAVADGGPADRTGSWFNVKEQSGGGVLINLGPHMIDQVLYAIGFPRPVEALGTMFRDTQATDGDVEDLAAGTVRFETGATLALLFNARAHCQARLCKTIELHGTRGRFVMAGPGAVLHTEDAGYLAAETLLLPERSYFAIQNRVFLDWIANGGPSPAPSREGYAIQAILDALYRSADSGRAATIDLDL